MRVSKPAVFLDRDGVIVNEKGYIKSVEEMEIYPFSRKCVEDIHSAGFYAVVVTNQSGIARGYFEEAELVRMNDKLTQYIGVDKVYYCPHHKDGIIPKYKILCECRKPKTGMIDQACRDFYIDLNGSYMVGDRACDITAGVNAGIKTVLLKTGYGIKKMEYDISPDYICENLEDFTANILLKGGG